MVTKTNLQQQCRSEDRGERVLRGTRSSVCRHRELRLDTEIELADEKWLVNHTRCLHDIQILLVAQQLQYKRYGNLFQNTKLSFHRQRHLCECLHSILSLLCRSIGECATLTDHFNSPVFTHFINGGEIAQTERQRSKKCRVISGGRTRRR